MEQGDSIVQLQPLIRQGLDILFIGLNPPHWSNNTGHYFSWAQSRFFHLLGQSGLTKDVVPHANADWVVFGGSTANIAEAAFGAVDLVEHLVETDSSMVGPTKADVTRLLDCIGNYRRRLACAIHLRVRNALARWGGFDGPLEYGYCGRIHPGVTTEFVLDYFRNDNSISDEVKLRIFADLRRRL